MHSDIYKLVVQQCIRNNYNKLFKSSENESTKPLENLKMSSFFKLVADESASDKQMFYSAIKQPNVKRHLINAHNQLLSQLVGSVDIIKEAHTEYECVYSKSMPAEYHQFITKDSSLS